MDTASSLRQLALKSPVSQVNYLVHRLPPDLVLILPEAPLGREQVEPGQVNGLCKEVSCAVLFQPLS